MASTITFSQAEQKRRGDLAYNGRTYRVFLVENGGVLDGEDTATAWLADELPAANGYAAVTGTITSGTGAWSEVNQRYEFPAIVASFTGAGTGFTYDTVVVRIGSEVSVVGILEESPPITLLAGQTQTYSIVLGDRF